MCLYGSLEEQLKAGDHLAPAGRLLSIRVLTADGGFPETTVWEASLEDAIELAANRGARVVNLSLGDGRHPYQPPAPVPVAAMLDRVARSRNLVIVVRAGNVAAAAYPPDSETATHFGSWLAEQPDAGLLPPAMAALALTVGAVAPDPYQGMRPPRDSVDHVPMSRPGLPSPLTRLGPGIQHMIKPDLVAPGGTYVYDRGLRRVAATPSCRVVGAGGTRPDRLLATDVGTSFAAPLVSHAALTVLGRHPDLSANAVRALLLAAAEPVEPVVQGADIARTKVQHQRFVGYGRPTAERAAFSSDHRAVLLAEETLKIDEVHFYKVPLPRLRGANQAASLASLTRWEAKYRGEPLILVVRNTRRWAAAGETQNYAVAVVLESAEDAEPVYDHLRVRLEPLIVAEVEAELGR